MKYFLVISILLIGKSAGSCLCKAERGGSVIHQERAEHPVACKEKLASWAFRKASSNKICSGNEEDFKIKWSCGGDFLEKTFSCKEMEEAIIAKALVDSALYSQYLASPEKLAPTIPSVGCGEDMPVQPQSSADQKIILKIEDENELRSVVKKLLPGIGESVLDSIDSGSLKFLLHNDNYVDGGEAKGDDMGDTHGFELSFTKDAGNGYEMTISYASNLYTNFANPENKGFWKDEEGNWHVAQYFIEENIGKILLEKQKKGDAFFWRVGGGVQQLNKSNPMGTFGLFSALGSQNIFHKQVSESYPGTAKLYDNLGQKGDEVAPFIEMGVGKRQTVAQKGPARVFLEGDLGARITGVEDASYVTIDAGAYYEINLGRNIGFKAGGGYQASVYADGTGMKGRHVDVIMGSRKIEAGLRYENRSMEIPGYQNALPSTVENREMFAPKDDVVWSVYIKYKW